MSKRKKILFITRWYPDRHDPMLGLFVQKHAQAVRLFNDVTVLYVTTDRALLPGKVIKEEKNFEGIKEFRIYFGKNKLELSNAVAYAKYYLQGLNWIEKSDGLPDISHVHILSRTAFPALWLKITKGIPYLITEHWSRYLPINIAKGAYRGWLRKWFTGIAVARAGTVTTVTQNLASAMQDLGLKNNYVVTPNVVNTEDFTPVEKNRNDAIKKLVHVSCFDEPAKNIRGIINAFQKIYPLQKNVILEIIGDGKDFSLVQDHAEQTGLLNSAIYFTGLLTGEQLISKMREATAFVMFSNYENLPCTIVESFSCGVPVISTDVGGIKEHLTEKFGILIPPRDENALADAMTSLLLEQAKFDRPGMRDYANRQFSLQSIGRLFNDIYQRLISSNYK